MAISHEHKFIFIKINKTGGTSIQKCLDTVAADLDLKGHRILTDYDVALERYFKFAFVRNPWDKMVSFYSYHLRKGFDLLRSDRGTTDAPPTFRQFVLEDAARMEFPNPNGASSRGMRASSQLDWLVDADGKVAMDFIGRFETLQRDFDTVCGKLGFAPMQLPRTQTSEHGHYTSYYDDDTRRAVERAFSRDIDYFGFRFGD